MGNVHFVGIMPVSRGGVRIGGILVQEPINDWLLHISMSRKAVFLHTRASRCLYLADGHFLLRRSFAEPSAQRHT